MPPPNLEVPLEPLLDDLLQLLDKSPQRTLIREVSKTQAEWSVQRFLHDVLCKRDELYKALGTLDQQQLSRSDTDVFICLLAPPGYRFAVLLYAIYILGAVACPLSPRILPGEAEYYLELAKCALLVTVDELRDLSASITKSNDTPVYVYSTSSISSPSPHLSAASNYSPISSTRGYLLVFTSGTTGKPKGVLHTRKSVENGIERQMSEFGLCQSDTWLHHEPVHWVFGPVSLMTVISAGACIEFCAEVFCDDWLLRRMQPGDATCVHVAPSSLQSLAERLEYAEKTWSSADYEAMLKGLRDGLRWFCTGAMNVNPRDLAIWKDIRGGKETIVAYGTTETLGINISTRGHSVPVGCCGVVRHDVDIKISHEGEVCLKSKSMFRRYITTTSVDPTPGAFDAEGFYMTGDLGHLEGGNLFITGRGKDIIRFHGWKLTASDIEHAILNHPHIKAAVVLGVPDSAAGERVAALVRLEASYSPGIEGNVLLDLRQWLRNNTELPVYKFPTMLRVLRDAEVVPRTASEKVQKDRVRDMYFAETDADNLIEKAGLDGEDVERRLWDWAGNA